MSHLTQILVPYELAVKRRIRDSYDWHQHVWQAFAGRDGQNRNFLSRLDEIDDAYRLLIVSPEVPVKPDWCPSACFATKPVGDDFFQHGRYHFSLLANPTRKVAALDAFGQKKKNGRRLAITKHEDLIVWLQRKAQAGGFDFGDPEKLRIASKPRSYFHKPGAAGVHFGVEFRGRLAVTDLAAFQQTFATGIGSAKAFGFGLLALAPDLEP
jgi:CRISPR system Cascade subunit CasE